MKLYFDHIFAVTAPGLEDVCAAELGRILNVEVAAEPGGVRFSGGLNELYLSNLHSRIATRFLVRIGEVRARDFSGFYNRCLKLPWGRFLKKETPVTIRVSSRGSRLVHTGRLAETIEKAIDHALGRSSSEVSGESGQLILARMEDDVCLISFDSSGELLHRRGYRMETALAPLRETLAAAILRLLEWNGDVPLVDPMCGSGTFVIEAALMASNRAAGIARQFAFMNWPRYRPGLWTALVKDAQRQAVGSVVAIHGSDAEPTAIASAQKNLERAGCEAMISLACQRLDSVAAGAETGLVLCNPPYGLRVGKGEDLALLYRQIGELYQSRFKGWRGALLCPPGPLAEATGLPLKRVGSLMNGGLKVTLFSVDL